MNVSFGLVALWLAFALAAMGVKGKGKTVQFAGSGAFADDSWGGTFVNLLRGVWPYSVQTVPGFDNTPGTVTTGPDGKRYIVPVDPNAPTIPVTPPASTTPSPAGANV